MGRHKGSGTLVKRGKVWLARWTVGGKTYFKSTKCSDRREALKKLDEFTRPFQCETEIEVLESLQAKVRVEEAKIADSDDTISSCKVSDVLDKWLSLANAPELACSTQDVYEGMVRSFAKTCDKLKVHVLREVTREVAEKHLEQLKDSSCAGRYNSVLALFKRMWADFKLASTCRCFKESPWDSFKYRKALPSVKRELTVEELMKLVAATDNDPQMNLLLCIGLYTGLRLGDCCNLKWREVDFVRSVITKIPEKTKRKTHMQVAIPIHPVLMNKLLEVKRQASPDDELVSGELSRMYSSRAIGCKINDLFKTAGVKQHEIIDGKKRTVCSFHSLRHTFVSMAASSGVSLDVLRTIVGHSSSAMTSHYAHMSQSALASAVNALPDLSAHNVVEAKAGVCEVNVSADVAGELANMGVSVEDVLKEYISTHKCKMSA